MRTVDYIIFPMLFLGLYTAIYFLYAFYENKQMVFDKPKKPSKLYTLSVLVPVYNEEKTVVKTLRSLVSLDYPKEKLKIIVIDDGSTDNTYGLVSRYIKDNKLKSLIQIKKKKNGGKYTALNHGLKFVKSELVCALDADSFVRLDSLKNMIHFFDDPLNMAVTPSMRIYKPKGILQRVQAIEYLMGLFLRKIFSVLSGEHVTPGPFTIFRKSFFDKYGPYRKAYHTEDIEVALRIQSLGYKIAHARNAAVYTMGPDKFDVLFKQRLRWYYGFIENVMDYKHLFSRKYGLLGVFILPTAFLSVTMVIISTVIALHRFAVMIKDAIDALIATNFDILSFLDFGNFDLFYVHVDSIVLLSILSLFIGLFMVLYAKKLSDEKLKIRFSYILFLLFYWILFATWWAVSIFYKITGKKTEWGHKSKTI